MVDLKPNDIVKSCKYIEQGSYSFLDGVRFCVMGNVAGPLLVSADELNQDSVTYETVIERRRELFEAINKVREGNTGAVPHL